MLTIASHLWKAKQLSSLIIITPRKLVYYLREIIKKKIIIITRFYQHDAVPHAKYKIIIYFIALRKNTFLVCIFVSNFIFAY